MTRRYYAVDLPSTGGVVDLSPAESRHARSVMRVAAGDAVTIFDGRGNEASAIVVSVGRDRCVCQCESATPIDRELTRKIELAIALPKPDRAKELIQRLTEIGVGKVIPLIAHRTQRPPSESIMEKLGRAVIEACKQCGRNELMEITPAISTSDYFRAANKTTRWIADLDASAGPIPVDDLPSDVAVAIGPEGGFASAEVASAVEHGFQPVRLGNRIYRVETAAAVIAAILSIGADS